MQRGYIKVWRKLEDSGIIGNAEVCQLFLYLMLAAAHRRKKQSVGADIVSLEPGQIVTSRRQLALTLGSKEQKIRTALSTLEKHEIINQLPTHRYTIISLINWGKYQHEQPTPNPRSNPQLTHSQPTPNPLLTHALKNESIKNIKPTSNTSLDINTPRARKAKPVPCGVGVFENSENGKKRPGARPPSETAVDSPSVAGKAPDKEFQEIRGFYDRKARAEGPLTGFAEFRRAVAARLWPGTARFCRTVEEMSEKDAQWLRGRAPGLKRFIAERMWEMRPRADPAGRTAEAPAKTPEQIAREQQEQQHLLKTLFAPPHKKKRATEHHDPR